jgi:hypothetical protein
MFDKTFENPTSPCPALNCKIFGGALRNVKVIHVMPLRRPLEGASCLAQERLDDEMGHMSWSRAYHSAVASFFEVGS